MLGVFDHVPTFPGCQTLPVPRYTHAGVQGMPEVTQTERTFVWTLITEITSACNGGPSVDFMLDAWRHVSTQMLAVLARDDEELPEGLQHEAAAVLRALATSVDLLGAANVRCLSCRQRVDTVLETCGGESAPLSFVAVRAFCPGEDAACRPPLRRCCSVQPCNERI